jgi:hypothetical protein
MEYETIAQVIFHSFDDYQSALKEAGEKMIAVFSVRGRVEFQFNDGSRLSFSKDGFMVV